MKGLLSSFRWAWQGLVYCLRTQRNLRIHLTVAALAVWLGSRFGLSRAEFALLWLTIGLVVAAELFNTAAEKLTDLCCPGFDRRAGLVKDIAAGAVLFAAAAAVGVGISLFWQPDLWRRLLAQPRQLAFPLAIAAVGAWAVFGLPYAKDKTNTDKEQE